MKSKFIILVLLCISFSNYAQLQKGRMFLGGNVNFFQSSSNSNDSAYYPQKSSNDGSNFQLNLNVGYFVSDHLALGILGSLWSNKSIDEREDMRSGFISNNSYSQNIYSGGLFARYYQMIKESKFGFFAQLNGSYGTGSNEQKSISQNIPNSEFKRKTEFSILSFGLSPGIVFFINDHFGIETSLGLFKYSKQDDTYYINGNKTGTGEDNRFTANFSISSLFLGMNYYF